MKEKIKIQKGFIQIPLLIGIIVSIIIVTAGISYKKISNQKPTTITTTTNTTAVTSIITATEPLVTTVAPTTTRTTTTIATTTTTTIVPLSTTTTTVFPVTTTITVPNQLQIVSDYTEAKTHSAILEWHTNQLTESKVYLSGGKLQSIILPSEAGLAYDHVIHIYNLDPAIIYSYKIVAIKNDVAVLKTGEFKTYSLAIPSFEAKIIRDDYALFNDDNLFYYYYIIQISSPEGIPYTNIKIKIDNKEYTTNNQGTILYRLKEKPKCGTNLILFILTDNIENGWTSYELQIKAGCVTLPTTPSCGLGPCA